MLVRVNSKPHKNVIKFLFHCNISKAEIMGNSEFIKKIQNIRDQDTKEAALILPRSKGNQRILVLEYFEGKDLKDEITERANERKQQLLAAKPEPMQFRENGGKGKLNEILRKSGNTISRDEFVKHMATYTETDEEETERLFLMLQEAIEHCHSLGVMHLDLKLENVLYNRETKELKLLDFGYQRYVGKPVRKSEEKLWQPIDRIQGTVSYFTPWTLKDYQAGQTCNYDFGSDYYALAFCKYQYYCYSRFLQLFCRYSHSTKVFDNLR